MSSELSRLVNLRELWLHNNPNLQALPNGMRSLEKLESLDIRNTQVSVLPPELVTLQRLYEVDWRETPLADKMLQDHDVQVNDLPAAQEVLQAQFTRANLEAFSERVMRHDLRLHPDKLKELSELATID
ncbi:MAG: hypothetical protein EBY26_07975 [Microbacteriaceae bacterium]|nr:hypothetical protein [Microbacteriaceae bacterium]